jgi:hypothetical protein
MDRRRGAAECAGLGVPIKDSYCVRFKKASGIKISVRLRAL